MNQLSQRERDDLLNEFQMNQQELLYVEEIVLPRLRVVSLGDATIHSEDQWPETSTMAIEMTVALLSLAVRKFECVDLDDTDESGWKQFLELVLALAGRGENQGRFSSDMLFEHCAAVNCCDGTDSESAPATQLIKNMNEFVQLCLSIYHQPRDNPQSPQSDVSMPWLRSLVGNENSECSVSRKTWNNWITETAPMVPHLVAQVCHFGLLGTLKEGSVDFLPKTDRPSFFLSENTAMAYQLSLMGLTGKYHQIFSSQEDGLSFLAFNRALTSYYGPTLTLVHTSTGETLGYYTQVPWKNSPDWQTGEGESFLLRLGPVWKRYCMTNAQSQTSESGCSNFLDNKKKLHQRLFAPQSSRGKANGWTGLAVGGITSDIPRLHISTSLERCFAGSTDTMFESGPLLGSADELPQSYFDVDVLEVYAVCSFSEQSSEKQIYANGIKMGKRHALIKESCRQRWAKVDKKQFLDDFQNNAYMNSWYEHQEYTTGRV